MKIDKQLHPEASRLILFFNGWSAPPALFRRLAVPPGTDCWIAYDYRDLTFDDAIRQYTDIRLIAWSLGVWVAEQIGRRYACLPIRSAVAINGTPRPIDAAYGIPPALFEGTLAHLSAEGIDRFTRRICGNRAIWETYRQAPARPTEAVAEELLSLHQAILSDETQRVQTAQDSLQTFPLATSLSSPRASLRPSSLSSPLPASPPDYIPWSQAILSRHDRIFPPENLHRYWSGRCPILEPEAPHYPFYLWTQWNELWKV